MKFSPIDILIDKACGIKRGRPDEDLDSEEIARLITAHVLSHIDTMYPKIPVIVIFSHPPKIKLWNFKKG